MIDTRISAPDGWPSAIELQAGVLAAHAAERMRDSELTGWRRRQADPVPA